MKQKLLAAALGILVLVPQSVFAQDARSLSPLAPRRLPALKASRSSSNDSNANGTIIGAAIGGALGALLGGGLASIDEGSDNLAGPVVLMALLGAAGGAGIGYAVDNAHHQVAYKIPLSKNVSIQPAVGLDKRPGHATGARAGVHAAFAW